MLCSPERGQGHTVPSSCVQQVLCLYTLDHLGSHAGLETLLALGWQRPSSAEFSRSAQGSSEVTRRMVFG